MSEKNKEEANKIIADLEMEAQREEEEAAMGVTD